MQEQSQRFCKASIKWGFVGELQKDQAVQQKVLNGHLDLVYISPENLINNPRYCNMLQNKMHWSNKNKYGYRGEHFCEAFFSIGEIRNTVNGERFAGLNFHSFQEYHKSFSVNITTSL